jgi:hypothetical protein
MEVSPVNEWDKFYLNEMRYGLLNFASQEGGIGRGATLACFSVDRWHQVQQGGLPQKSMSGLKPPTCENP